MDIGGAYRKPAHGSGDREVNRRRFIMIMQAGIGAMFLGLPGKRKAYTMTGKPTNTVTLRDTGKALINPDMGWTMHFYSNIISNYGSKLEPSDTLDDFPGLSTIYLRVPWSFLEPREGEFNWSLLDTPAQRWISKGKRIALRISCSESWMRYATPQWVEEAGAKGYNFTPGKGAIEDGTYWEPDYGDPVFLDKLEAFLIAMAQRYDGNENVAFIDIGSYGVWGEGHTHSSTKLEYDDDVPKQHIDLHCKHFKDTLLCISDDYVGPSKPGRHFPLSDYALSRGVTLRDDSIMVQPPPRSWYHAEMAQEFWPHFPVILEHEHYGGSVKRGAWDKSLFLKSVEDYHASYMSIHWWPRILLNENRDVINRINLRMGYRLQLREAIWPKSVRLGESFVIETKWANAGVAPCYPGGYMAIAIKDDKGGIVSAHVDESFNMRDLKTGPKGEAPVHKLSSALNVAPLFVDGPRSFSRAAQPGEYDLYVSVGLRDGTPRIVLPHEGDDGQKRYKLGKIEVLGRG